MSVLGVIASVGVTAAALNVAIGFTKRPWSKWAEDLAAVVAIASLLLFAAVLWIGEPS